MRAAPAVRANALRRGGMIPLMVRRLFRFLPAHFDCIRTWLFGARATPESPAEPSDWCLVGNVVEEHEFGESKEIRRGSKHFTPGAKVYCLPPQWGDGYEKVVAVGIARGSRRWITVVMSSDLITNWRAKVVYKPAVIRRLREGFNGFKRQWKSQKEVQSYAEAMRRSKPG
jgi:hypothetical protein